MIVHTFGKDKDPVIVLIHPSVVYWDYFERVIPFLETNWQVLVPELPGYEPETDSDFTSVEEISKDLAFWLEEHNIARITCMYGCSMGGSIVLRFVADHAVPIQCAVIDGGITPYQLPWIATRAIAVRDYLMITIGKAGGVGLLEKAFATDAYSKEDLEYISQVLKHMSSKTIWNTFESCNNYEMPDRPIDGTDMEYWYAEKEKQERKWDIRYMRRQFPGIQFCEFKGSGHGGLAVTKPQLLARELERLIQETKERKEHAEVSH